MAKIILYAVDNKLIDIKIKWKNENAMTVVLCSKGYPGSYKKGIHIKNLRKLVLKKNQFIFHAGTQNDKERIVSNGGRVLNITSIGKKFLNTRIEIIKILKKLNWKYGFYRKDIGWRVIKIKWE